MEKYRKAAHRLILIGCFVLVCAYIAVHGTSMLDADMSSEMVLANHLAEENAFLSSRWWYSTELRVVNTQLVLMPLFKLMDDWTMVRTVGSAVLMAIYLLCYRFFLGSIGLKKYFSLSGAFLILPISIVYFVFVVFGLYYIPHICFTFLVMGLMFRIPDKSGAGKVVLLALLCLLAFAAGLGGLRQLLVCNIPLVAAAMVFGGMSLFAQGEDKERKEVMSYVLSSLLAAGFAVAGYLVNTAVLARRYSFQFRGGINYLLPTLERVEMVLREWIAAFGYTEGNAFTLRTVYNLGCLCLIVLTYFALRDILGRKEKYSLRRRFVAMFFVLAALIYSVFIICTDFEHVGRYCLPVAIFALPVLTIYFAGMDRSNKYVRAASAVFCALMLLCCVGKLRNQYQQDTTAELRQLTGLLASEGYNQGYSTFWTGNMITELSDGKIEMWVLRHSINDLDDIYPWLQAKEHAQRQPEGPIFLLFQEYEMKEGGFVDTLDKNKIVYSSDNYTVFCFENREEAMSAK